MPDDRKVFDIARPTATATTRPVIPAGLPVADPMVRAQTQTVARSIPLTFETDDEQPMPTVSVPPTSAAPPENPAAEVEQPSPPPVNEELKPEISNVAVSQMPEESSAESAAAVDGPTSSAITPALPGAPGSSFASVPKFGELQSKIDAHPLFSGHKEKRVKVRHLPHVFWPLASLLILIIIAYLAIDAGVVRGASHLPYHIFKQPSPLVSTPAIAPVKTTPAVTKPVVQPTPSPQTVTQFSTWHDYSSASYGYSLSYPTDYGAFTNDQNTDPAITAAMTSGVPKVGLANVAGALNLIDYKTASAAIPTYKNGPTIELQKGSWVVATASPSDTNRYKVGQVFKDISTVKNTQGQSIYTIVSSGDGTTSYIIVFISDKTLHTLTLPPFTVQKADSSGINDQTAYDAMFRQLRSSIKITP